MHLLSEDLKSKIVTRINLFKRKYEKLQKLKKHNIYEALKENCDDIAKYKAKVEEYLGSIVNEYAEDIRKEREGQQ